QRNTPRPGSQTPANPKGTSFTGPPRSNEEFSGGTIGGPILKNKVFIFGGFDSDLFSGSNVFTTTAITPTPAGLAKLPGCGVNATALSVLQNFGPYAFSFGNPTARPTHTTGGAPDGLFSKITIGTCVAANSLDPNGVEVGGVTRVVSAPFHGFDFVI